MGIVGLTGVTGEARRGEVTMGVGGFLQLFFYRVLGGRCLCAVGSGRGGFAVFYPRYNTRYTSGVGFYPGYNARLAGIRRAPGFGRVLPVPGGCLMFTVLSAVFYY